MFIYVHIHTHIFFLSQFDLGFFHLYTRCLNDHNDTKLHVRDLDGTMLLLGLCDWANCPAQHWISTDE